MVEPIMANDGLSSGSVSQYFNINVYRKWQSTWFIKRVYLIVLIVCVCVFMLCVFMCFVCMCVYVLTLYQNKLHFQASPVSSLSLETLVVHLGPHQGRGFCHM